MIAADRPGVCRFLAVPGLLVGVLVLGGVTCRDSGENARPDDPASEEAGEARTDSASGTKAPESAELPLPYGSADVVYLNGAVIRHADSSAAWNRERSASLASVRKEDVVEVDVVPPEDHPDGRGVVRITTRVRDSSDSVSGSAVPPDG